MSQYELEDMLQLMRELRHPEHGCPWDRKQNFATIVPYTLEEAYEVADAIERENMPDLKKELGDLLFQVIFYARLAEEKGEFTFADVVSALVSKLLRRHPHVFPDGTLASAGTAENNIEEGQIKENWETIKQQERSEQQQHSLVDDVPTTLPALSRALKLQKRVAQVGFDWSDEEAVFEKITEELTELRDAISAQDRSGITEEVGDLLFTCVNLSRHLGVDPETALRESNHKFVCRFRHVEQTADESGHTLSTMTTEQLEGAWQQAKLLEP